jgi:hypothetical protein
VVQRSLDCYRSASDLLLRLIYVEIVNLRPGRVIRGKRRIVGWEGRRV